MSFGNDYENEILEYIFPGGGVAVSPEAQIQIALSTADPLDDGSGLAEPSGGNYARITGLDNSSATWNQAAAGQKTNKVILAFNEASASWGTITHWAIFDESTGTKLLCHGALAQSKTIGAGESLRFDLGDLVLNLN